jgi:hypothetical protein
MTVTVWKCAAREARRRGRVLGGTVSAGDFEELGFPFYVGCECCGAGLAPYNAYPSRSGFIRCGFCIGAEGFPSAAAFEKFYGVQA